MSSIPLLGGRYRLLDRLGRGGTSVVWRAYDHLLRRTVAVKLLANQTAGAASREFALTEARTAARLSHPHICQVYDFGEAQTESGEHVAYIVMELLSGPTLQERLRDGPMPVGTALRICAQVASALAAAHSCGLAHRDVKPANVMLTRSGPKVVDFGIAATAGAPDELGSDGEMWGTPAYLAPERLVGGEVTPASDVYALGLVLYRMVSGSAPWSAETVTEMLDAHQYQEPAPLPPADGVPDSVAELCRSCLAKEPDQRPTAHEVARRLAGAVGWEVSRAGEELIEVGGEQPEPDPEPDPEPEPEPDSVATESAQVERDKAEAGFVAGWAPGLAAPPAADADPGASDPGPDPQASTPGDREVDQAPPDSRRSPRRLVLVAAVSVAAVLAVAISSIVTSDSPTNRREPDVAGVSGGPSAGAPASHATGGELIPTDAGGAGGPVNPGQTDAPGGARPGPVDPADDDPTTPDVVAPEPEPGPTEGPEEPPSLAEEVVETPGGSVLARCDRNAASVEPVELAPGFRVIDETRGPGTVRAGIVLGSADQEVRVDVRCRAGEPTSTVESTDIDS